MHGLRAAEVFQIRQEKPSSEFACTFHLSQMEEKIRTFPHHKNDYRGKIIKVSFLFYLSEIKRTEDGLPLTHECFSLIHCPNGAQHTFLTYDGVNADLMWPESQRIQAMVVRYTHEAEANKEEKKV